MQTTFDSRNDELFHAIGMFFVKWSWLEDALTYLLESVLDIDEAFGGLVHEYLSTDAKLNLISIVSDRLQANRNLEYEWDAMKRLVRRVQEIKKWRNILAHQPLTDLFGSFPQTDDMGEIGALSLRQKKYSGKTDVPVITVEQLKKIIAEVVDLEAFGAQLAAGFCALKGRRIK